MSKLVVTEFLTLDGVMEDPGGAEGFDRGGWSFEFPDPEGMKFKLEEQMEADAMLLGRITYEGFAAAWLWSSRSCSAPASACSPMRPTRPRSSWPSARRWSPAL